jgi:NADH-ubiquinone oxidoreductase chain 5
MSAGSVIHATGEQDIRKMGSLYKMLPITYNAMLIASLSLIGFPFLSGFYSKDFLLEATYNIFGSFSYVIYFISAISTSVSSFYSFRLIYFVFFGDIALSKKVLKGVSESSYFLYIPLIILTILSIFSGFYLKDLMTIQTSLYNFIASPLSDIPSDQDFFSDFFKILPSIFSLLGLFLVYFIYTKNKIKIQESYRFYLLFSYLSCKKFFADAFNSFYIFLPAASFSLNTTYKLIDQGFLEYFGSTGIYRSLESIYEKLVTIETTSFIYRSFLFLIFASGLLIALVYTKAITLIFLLSIATYLIVPKLS